MTKKKVKEPKQNGLTMSQIEGYFKKSKGSKKLYWKGRKTIVQRIILIPILVIIVKK